MDIEVEYKPLKPFCHGCLSEDRNISRITGDLNEMFHKLRNDEKFNKYGPEAKLCWECIAFLKKLKEFQAKIKTAQSLLIQYLQSYYMQKPTSKPNSLSSLTNTHRNNYYDVDLIEEVKYSIEEPLPYTDNHHHTNIEINFDSLHNFDSDEKDFDITDNFDSEEIKYDEEKIEIKQETEDFNCTDYKQLTINYRDTIQPKSTITNTVKPKSTVTKTVKPKSTDTIKSEKPKQKQYKRSLYLAYATVTKRKLKKVQEYEEVVCLSQKEYEIELEKERRRYQSYSKLFTCTKCEFACYREQDFQWHTAVSHSKKPLSRTNCPECNKFVDNLSEHWTSTHTKLLKCKLCTNSKLFRGVELQRHLRCMHNKIYKCNICMEEFRLQTDFGKHYKTVHEDNEKVVCDYCNQKLAKKSSLISHINHHHTPIHCDKCNREYINRKTYVYHNLMIHPEQAANDKSKELSYCVECDKQYPSVYKYKRHLQFSAKHNPPKKQKVPCPDCGKIFSRKSFMKNHYKFAHLKVTKHYCDICCKYFTNGYGLRKHIDGVHKKIALPKNKICDICGRGFGTNKILTNHRRTHTGERPHKCPYCPAAFAQVTAMKTHQKTQHKTITLEIGK